MDDDVDQIQDQNKLGSPINPRHSKNVTAEVPSVTDKRDSKQPGAADQQCDSNVLKSIPPTPEKTLDKITSPTTPELDASGYSLKGMLKFSDDFDTQMFQSKNPKDEKKLIPFEDFHDDSDDDSFVRSIIKSITNYKNKTTSAAFSAQVN